MSTSEEEYLARIRTLEKANRVLQRKLERTQTDRVKLEETNEKKESLLRKVIHDLNLAERQLQNLIQGTAATTGQNFFPALASHIAETLNVAYTLVTEQVEDTLQTLAFWADGTLQPTYAYDPAQTPCEHVLDTGEFYCEHSVRQLFPNDLDLVEMDAEGYLGIALRNNQGTIIGHLCIIDQKPIKGPQRAKEILRVFAARASAELERQRASILLQQLNQELESNVKERTSELRASEAQIRAMIEAIPDLLLRVKQDGTCIDYVQSRNQIGEFLPIQQHLSEVLPPFLLQQQLDTIEQAIATGALQVYEHHFQKRDRLVYEEVRISALSSDEALIIVRDVTERKQVENELQEYQHFIQTVLNTVPLPVFWKDRDSVFLGCNQQFVNAMGVQSATELIGKTDFDFSATQARASDYRADDRWVMESGKSKLGIEETLTSPIGEQRWLETHKAPLRDWAGHIIGLVGTFQDVTDRKQAEASLCKSEATLAEAQQVAHVGNWEFDIQSQKIIWSKELFHMFSLDPNEPEPSYKDYLQMIHPDDQELMQQYMKRAIAGESPYTIDYRIIQPNGSIRYHEGRAEVERDAHGHVVRLFGTALDITERKQAEIRLRESEARYRSIYTQTAVGLVNATLKGEFLEVNPRFCEMLGYSRKELLSKTVKDVTHPDDQARILPALQRLFRGDVPYFFQEKRYLCKDGTCLWADTGVALVRDAAGNPRYTLAVICDITDRKQLETERKLAEEHLSQLSTRLNLAVTSAGIGIWDWDITHNTLTWDDQMYKLYGISPKQFNNAYEAWMNGLHPDDRAAAEAVSQQARRGETEYDTEFRVVHPDGTIHFIKANALIQFNPQGEAQRMIGTNYDITEQKQAEIQLKQTNDELIRATRLKDEFLANMSHELRTPLNAILGMTEGLQEEVFGSINKRQLKALQTVEQSSTHLLELINDILDVAKIESGQMQLNCSPTAIVPLCQSSLSFIKQQALKKRIQLETQFPSNLPDGYIDERYIRQVLINLLTNAVKFTPNGGHITLKVSVLASAVDSETADTVDADAASSPNYLRIAIMDTGIGIARNDIPKLFQPFVQIDSALNRKYQGTGLGLALVKRVVDLHGGQVNVSSQVGDGSCFTIDLPCTASSSSSPRLNAPPQSIADGNDAVAAASPMILLAEDNEANINTVSSYLSARGYRLILANNGHEAIALAQSEHPDLILMDIQMPGMDGLEAMQHIRQDPTLVDVPIIALTALAMTGDQERCLAAGATNYLSKPIKLKQLAVAIQNLLNQRVIT